MMRRTEIPLPFLRMLIPFMALHVARLPTTPPTGKPTNHRIFPRLKRSVGLTSVPPMPISAEE
jgi:hypothetical protein